MHFYEGDTVRVEKIPNSPLMVVEHSLNTTAGIGYHCVYLDNNGVLQQGNFLAHLLVGLT